MTIQPPDIEPAPRPNVLTTFKAPRPNAWLMRGLDPVNRVLCLGGIPGLRGLPLLSAVPGVRGLADVVRLDLPAGDLARLERAVNRDTAAFIAPNHPEFFTDWMIDKEILSRVAPLSACWATHVVVNGMGPVVQRFWLANNLVAQIPGAGGRAGRDYSVGWAVSGHGVLLHPEGDVGWHGDTIGPVFPGAVEMAAEAAGRLAIAGTRRDAWVVPIVWKLRFTGDVEAALHGECDYVEARLKLDRAAHGASPAARMHAAYLALLARDEAAAGLDAAADGFDARQRRLATRLAAQIVVRLELAERPPSDPADDIAASYRDVPARGRPPAARRGRGQRHR